MLLWKSTTTIYRKSNSSETSLKKQASLKQKTKESRK